MKTKYSYFLFCDLASNCLKQIIFLEMNPVLLVLIVRQKSDYFVSKNVFIIFIFFLNVHKYCLPITWLTLFRGYRLLLVTVTALLRYKFVYLQGNL